MRNLLAVAAVALMTAACGDQPAGHVPDGRTLYQALNCRSCHVIGGEGARGGPDLTFVGFRHNKEWLDRFLQDPSAWRRGTLMPDPRLSPARRAALVDYLASLKGEAYAGDSAPWRRESDPVKRGHRIYGAAGCIACHGKGGAGGYPNNNVAGGLIPALKGVSATFSRPELMKKLRAGSKPVKKDPAGPEPLVAMPSWGQALSGEDLDALADYLFSLKDASAGAGDW